MALITENQFINLNAADFIRGRKAEHQSSMVDHSHLGSMFVNHKTIGACNLEISYEISDTDRAEKEKALIDAVTLVQNTGYKVPDIKAFISKKPGVRCIAWIGNAKGERDVKLFIGPQAIGYTPKAKPSNENLIKGGMGQGGKRGVADQIYDNKSGLAKTKRTARATALMVHEIGHILHEYQSENKYWNLKGHLNGELTDAKIAAQISHYVTQNNLLEMVAEIFTGLIYKIQYSIAILNQYTICGGPLYR